MSDPRFDPNRVKVISPPSTGVGPVSATLDGLPKQFVAALRTLFDILDDKASGYVKFSDIEKRWQDDGTKGLPKGVIESLRKVTPPNGLLSFERFCAGLKICLLRNQMEGRSRAMRVGGNGSGGGSGGGGGESSQPPARPPSAPLLDLDGPPKGNASQWAGVARQPHPTGSSMAQQRTLSMPQLPPATDPSLGIPVKPPLYGPPKPPRSAIGLDRVGGGSTGVVGGSGGGGHVDKAEIRSALQSWQLGMMKEEEKRMPGGGAGNVGGGGVGGGYSAQPPPAAAVAAVTAQQATGQARQRSMGDGKPPGGLVQDPNGQGQHKKQSGRRREPRRHTLQNGIDYNMLKRMKQIEVEKDVLMQGLEAVDRARDWYMKQIAAVQEKMKYLGRMGHSEQWTEAQDERLELQRARILEINRHLATLTEPGERGGLPLHINLAVSPHSSQILARLKQQNHILTQEVSKKNDRITALEREKASLIRELFHSRTAQSRPREQPQDNTAYI